MSRFVINVTKNGDRLFSTSRTSIGADNAKATEILLAMQAGFPAAAGYSVECFYIATTASASVQKIGTDGTLIADEGDILAGTKYAA